MGRTPAAGSPHPRQPRSHSHGRDLGQGTSSQKGEMWGDPVPSSGSVRPHTLLMVTRQRDLAGGGVEFGEASPVAQNPHLDLAVGLEELPAPGAPHSSPPSPPSHQGTQHRRCPGDGGPQRHPALLQRAVVPAPGCPAGAQDLGASGGMGPTRWWCHGSVNSWQGRKS